MTQDNEFLNNDGPPAPLAPPAPTPPPFAPEPEVSQEPGLGKTKRLHLMTEVHRALLKTVELQLQYQWMMQQLSENHPGLATQRLKKSWDSINCLIAVNDRLDTLFEEPWNTL